jgi:hypothetical protein
MRATHIMELDSLVESMSSWITKDRITQTPAWACPARHSDHCFSSKASSPGAKPAISWVRIPSRLIPPYIIVGTARSVIPETSLASRDSRICGPNYDNPVKWSPSHEAGSRPNQTTSTPLPIMQCQIKESKYRRLDDVGRLMGVTYVPDRSRLLRDRRHCERVSRSPARSERETIST